jgi:ferritin-like metal-binding protein YciE
VALFASPQSDDTAFQKRRPEMLASSGGQSNSNAGQSRDEQISSKLIPHIQNAHALENQIVQSLEGHVKELSDLPDVQQQVRMHLEQTKQHRDRMEQCLNAYGESPSAIKEVGSSLMGSMMAAMGGMRADTISRIARDEYVTEHLEIAAYTLLITTARAFGDEETAQAAEMNLRDEIQMQEWLLSNMPDVCLRDLQQQGYDVSGAGQGAQYMQGSGGYSTTTS